MGIRSYLKCSDICSNRFFHSFQNKIYYFIVNYLPHFLDTYLRCSFWIVWFRTFMAVYCVGFIRWVSLGDTFRTMARASSLKKKIKLLSKYRPESVREASNGITDILNYEGVTVTVSIEEPTRTIGCP